MIQFSEAAVQADHPAPRTILAPLNLTLAESRISIIGANGSGKSTLLKLINSLVLPTSGQVTVDGLDTARKGAAVRQSVAFMFTDPLSQLVMPTGREDVELSLRRRYRDRGERRTAAVEVLGRFGLAHLADQSVYDLSGGERQLLALATVLACDPKVLVADEPTTLLDLRNSERVRRLFRGLDQQVIFTTHSLDFALQAERTLVVDSGRVIFDGVPADAVAAYRDLSLHDASAEGPL
ncbi:cobalt ABC transporter ATP-binding protein [Arthrobacter sp. Soil782]|uniref:energy-coupling factor ABC transporter ATP-binding protein n=1 Tax=Arthrobacter sp. Soil782 TaxID=1736410 RepID=UPI0006F458E5|nr:ABC transporter ATP-binding protein [Arthrobacter sp. Soil782]KRF06310.1 cobalt ABC transporter ATP-binding protein [Arthrobacter sp. Soil782]